MYRPTAVLMLATGLSLYSQVACARPTDAAPATRILPSPATVARRLGGPIEPTVPPLPTSPLEVKIQAIEPLKLDQAIAAGLERSTQLQLARVAIEKSQAVVRQREASLFPTVSFSGSYTYNQLASSKVSSALLNRTGAGSISSVVSQTETAPFSEQVQLSYTIFSSGLVGNQILAARESLDSTLLDYERTRQELLKSMITAYFDLQEADGNVQIGEASVRSAGASLRDAKAQEAAGTGTHFSVLQAEVQLANAQQELLGYQNTRIVAQRELARQLNFPSPTDVTAADTVEKSTTWGQTLEETILQAYRNRVELAQYLAQERSAQAQAAAYSSSLGPQLSLVLTGQAYDNTLDAVSGIYTGYSAAAQVSWSLFDGGAAQAQAEQSNADGKTARINYTNTRNTIRYDVESAYSSMLTSTLQIDTTTTAITSAEEALRIARLRFQAGIGTQTDVITADRDLTEARVNRLQAIVSYNRAIASLRRATNTL